MPRNLIPNQFDYSGIYVEGQRSQFRFNKGVQSSFMSGMFVPLGDPIRVFPGVKLGLKLDANIMSNTMVAVPLNGMYVDFFAVWVPDRILWTHQPQFLGENDATAWTQSSTYTYPSVQLHDITNSLYTLLTSSDCSDESIVGGNNFLAPHYSLYYGQQLLSGTPGYSQDINVLAIRGYYACWNHLIRDENYQRPVLFSKGDVGSVGEFGYFIRDYDSSPTAKVVNNLIDTATGLGLGDPMPIEYACLMPVNKLHDAKTSVLPQPQYGNSVSLGNGMVAPIIADTTLRATGNPIMLGKSDLTQTDFQNRNLAVSTYGYVARADTPTGGTGVNVGSTNLLADLRNALGTINQFRANVMTQRFLEALARGGRRVPELYEAIWSVKNTAAQKDYPELLSHERYVMGVQQVVATADGSGSGWTSHLGDRGAYSLTVLRDVPVCEREFTEFGYLHICYCVRSTNQYSQSLPQHFTHKLLLDEYNPYFDHIGDVDLPNHLVNVIAASSGNFGYQEAWWFERTQENICCAALNKAYGSLGYHVIGEVYDVSLVTCTPGYLTFDPSVFNDVFVSAYYAYPQFIIDANIKGVKAARMSQHSIPGIVGRI